MYDFICYNLIGWVDSEVLGAMIEYLVGQLILIARGARILCGYEFPLKAPPLPRLCFADSDPALLAQLDKFLYVTLHLETHFKGLMPAMDGKSQGQCYPYVKTCFAVFLMRLSEVNTVLI